MAAQSPGAPPAQGSSRNTSRFDFLGDDEVKEVVDFLDGAALGFLAESGVVTGPLCGLLRRWWRRWRRNSTLSAAFAFLEPGDLGPVVAAYFAEDPPLAHAAHAASCDSCGSSNLHSHHSRAS